MPSAQNVMDAMRFYGTDDRLEFDGNFVEGSIYSAFFIVARNSPDDWDLVIGEEASAGDSHSLHVGYRNNATFTSGHWCNDLNVTIPGFTNRQYEIWEVHFDTAGGKQTYRNNVSMGVAVWQTAPLGANYNTGWIGGHGTLGFLSGDLGDVIVYDRRLTNAERTRVFNYLNNKWKP